MRRLPGGRELWRFGWAMSEHGAFRAASAMAFDAFLSILPLLAIVGWALQRMERGDVVLAPILRALPGPAAHLADADLLRFSDQQVMTLAPISVVGFLWLSSAGVATAMAVCETMFACAQRPWLRRRVIAIGWVVGSLGMIVLAMTTTIACSRKFGEVGGRIAGVLVIVPILLALVFAFFQTAIRRPGAMKRRVLPGALTTVALWVFVSIAFSLYAQTLARYSLVYGSLASVAMVLIWFWLLSLALLAGGEVNAQLEGVRVYPPSTVALDARR